MAEIPHSRMASTRSGCAAVRLCVRACTHRWLSCGVSDGRVGASFVPGPRSSALAGRKPSSRISGSTVMRMFGVMDLSSGFDGCRFAIGLRNSHDKSFRLSCTVGLRVFVCENLAFHGEYTPVLAKHSKHFSLEDSL